MSSVLSCRRVRARRPASLRRLARNVFRRFVTYFSMLISSLHRLLDARLLAALFLNDLAP
ncbi:MAG: hypothetical protein V3V08_13375 [Nannocystaceae bacterium]